MPIDYDNSTPEKISNAKVWFSNKVTALLNKSKMGAGLEDSITSLRDIGGLSGIVIGKMLYFKYRPKGEATLRYYDMFPLIIVIDEYKDGLLGLNLHYLPPTIRARFLTSLMDIINNKKFDRTTRIRVTYELLVKLRKYRFFKPSMKRYLYSHMVGRPLVIKSIEWPKAILLPLAIFRKAGSAKVWRESREQWSKV